MRITVYDILGREVRALVNQTMPDGYQRVEWDGKNTLGISVASGIYIYRFEAGGYTAVKKMVVVR